MPAVPAVAEKASQFRIVDFKKPVGIEFMELADYLEAKLKRKVDLVSLKGVKPQYLKVIEQEIIYV